MKQKRFARLHNLSYYITLLIRGLISVLVLVLLLAFSGGIIRMLMDLKSFFSTSTEEVLRHLLVNVLILLALVEVLNTAVNYLKEGRVRVTFIIDTVFIVMLNEVMSSWFKGLNSASFFALLIILGSLMALRIFAIRYSPGKQRKKAES